MEDADSVLVTGHQYRTSNCYMDAFIEHNRSAFRSGYCHTLHRTAAARSLLARPFYDTSISELAQIGIG